MSEVPDTLCGMRVFAAISLPDSVRDHLAGALEMVSPPAVRHPWSPPENWHITLAFYGERPSGIVDELAGELRAVAAQTAPFEIGLAGAGVFRHEVCWIGVSDPGGGLGALAQAVRTDYATADQHAHSRFHVTVARVPAAKAVPVRRRRSAGPQDGLDYSIAALSVYRGPVWTVDHITLFRSDLGGGPAGHPLYTALAEVGFGGRRAEVEGN